MTDSLNRDRSDNLIIEEQEFENEKPLNPENLSAQPTERVIREEEPDTQDSYKGSLDSIEVRESKLVFEKHAQPINPNQVHESDMSQEENSYTPKERQDLEKERKNVPNPTTQLEKTGLQSKKPIVKQGKMEKKHDKVSISVSNTVAENASHLTPKKTAYGAARDAKTDLLISVTPKVIALR